MRSLLSRGGDVLRGDVLHWAVERSGSDAFEVTTLLLEEGAPLGHLRFERCILRYGIVVCWEMSKLHNGDIVDTIFDGQPLPNVLVRFMRFGGRTNVYVRL